MNKDAEIHGAEENTAVADHVLDTLALAIYKAALSKALYKRVVKEVKETCRDCKKNDLVCFHTYHNFLERFESVLGNEFRKLTTEIAFKGVEIVIEELEGINIDDVIGRCLKKKKEIRRLLDPDQFRDSIRRMFNADYNLH